MATTRSQRPDAHRVFSPSYLAQFVGREECGISSKHLYNPPTANGDELELKDAYCQNRASLLDAMSNGGRHGFDAPYIPQGKS